MWVHTCKRLLHCNRSACSSSPPAPKMLLYVPHVSYLLSSSHTQSLFPYLWSPSPSTDIFFTRSSFSLNFFLNSRCLQEENTLLKYLLQIFKLRCAMTRIIPRVMTIVWTLLLLVTSKHLNMFVDYLFLLKATRYYIVLFSMYLMNDV